MLLTLKIFIFFLSIGLTMSACQLTPVHKIKPTSVREDFQPVTPGSSGGTPVGTAALASTASDIPITEQTVLLDARSAFEYSTSHVRGSYHLRWEDFTQKDDKYKGLLVEDLFFHTRRLARMGIGPNTPVVIFGAGPTGDASEGRLAWTLKYLGVADVQIMAIGSTRLPQTSVPTDPKLEVPAWRPQQQPEPTSKPQSVSEQIQSPVKTMSVSSTNTIKNLSDLKEKTQQRTVWIIDVRSEKEYLRLKSRSARRTTHHTPRFIRRDHRVYSGQQRPSYRWNKKQHLRRLGTGGGIGIYPAFNIKSLSRTEKNTSPKRHNPTVTKRTYSRLIVTAQPTKSKIGISKIPFSIFS
jgi:3-mercaptopyruvate sulfurtransferase SseA